MRKLGVLLAIGFVFGGLLSPSAKAEFSLHGLFTENMVLQQGDNIPVWGQAESGEKITVHFQENKVTVEPKNGKWMVRLKNLKPGGPYTMTVEGRGKKVEFKNILVGEVWVCSGQSNMEWPMTLSRDPKESIASAKNPMIRLFQVPKTPKNQSIRELGNNNAKWQECNPQTVPGFSAVGYYFGKYLSEARKVPVGLIQSAWGGTPAEHWTPADILNNLNIKGNSTLYNGMISPLRPFAIKGVIWYQGESNAGQAKDYERLFSAMIKSWRDKWDPSSKQPSDFSFLFVQLAPWDQAQKDTWAFLREAQLRTSQKVDNTAMAVITDFGDRTDIHPKDKDPVGKRLALAARAIAYKEDIVYSGPEFTEMKVNGNKAVLHFKHVGGGLVAKDGDLKGFTIAGKDGKFVPGTAKIEGNTVVVTNPNIETPTAVRYGWANFPIVNLFNRDGLPATPFRTDN